jgi:hypothetical protein
MDEITRLAPELVSVFCGALNKQVRAGVEVFVFNSGIPDGAGGTEEFCAPCHNLSIVATCNEGSGYNVNPEDKAEMQRWLHVRVSFNAAEARKIANTVLFDSWGVADADSVELANKLVEFLIAARELALVHSRLHVPPTIRCVVDAITIASSYGESEIAETLWLIAKGWFCGLDPTTNLVEEEHVNSLLACYEAAKLPRPSAI